MEGALADGQAQGARTLPPQFRAVAHALLRRSAAWRNEADACSKGGELLVGDGRCALDAVVLEERGAIGGRVRGVMEEARIIGEKEQTTGPNIQASSGLQTARVEMCRKKIEDASPGLGLSGALIAGGFVQCNVYSLCELMSFPAHSKLQAILDQNQRFRIVGRLTLD